MAKISNRQIKAWEKFNEDLKAFALESEGSGEGSNSLRGCTHNEERQ